MKLLAIIFAFLILALSTIPCSDNGQEATDAIHSEKHDHDLGEDGCTTFCSCSCCGIAIPFEVLFFLFEGNNSNGTIVFHNFWYLTNFTKGYITSIWHPPATS